MPKQGLVEIVNIIDRSGSMASIRDDAIGGFNSFLDDQKKVPGEAKVTLVLFDHEYLLVHDGVDINDVPNLDEESYVPRGWTALYDAIGRAINTVGERLANTPEDERPEKVIVSILTDGEENHSREFSVDQIEDMITHQQDNYKWEFIYLATNQDAFAVGNSIGIASANTMSFDATGVGISNAYRSLSKTYSDSRTSGLTSMNDPQDDPQDVQNP
jgi:uncharacterized protein YegL